MAKTDTPKKEIDALFVKAVPARGFRRCGFSFSQEGRAIAVDELTADQIKTLEAEPNLVVTKTTIEV